MQKPPVTDDLNSLSNYLTVLDAVTKLDHLPKDEVADAVYQIKVRGIWNQSEFETWENFCLLLLGEKLEELDSVDKADAYFYLGYFRNVVDQLRFQNPGTDFVDVPLLPGWVVKSLRSFQNVWTKNPPAFREMWLKLTALGPRNPDNLRQWDKIIKEAKDLHKDLNQEKIYVAPPYVLPSARKSIWRGKKQLKKHRKVSKQQNTNNNNQQTLIPGSFQCCNCKRQFKRNELTYLRTQVPTDWICEWCNYIECKTCSKSTPQVAKFCMHCNASLIKDLTSELWKEVSTVADSFKEGKRSKDNGNRLLVGTYRDIISRGIEPNILLLDGPDCMSTQKLLQAGANPKNIWIVNKTDSAIAIRDKQLGVNVVPMSFADFESGDFAQVFPFPKEGFHLEYLDFCGFLETQLKESNIFDHTAEQVSILATFSQRGGTDDKEVKTMFNENATKFGYQMELDNVMHYTADDGKNSGMFTVAYDFRRLDVCQLENDDTELDNGEFIFIFPF